MAKFLADNVLNAELEKLLLTAKEEIILISPYIKLHKRYSSALNQYKDKPTVKLIIIFGKNSEDMSKSMKKEDFDYFKEFPNIEIRHEERLHAKYYANESISILTSMNLYSYSQDTNIEFGVLTKRSRIKSLTNIEDLDHSAYEYFGRVYDESTLLYSRIAERETKLGILERYLEPKIIVDRLTDFFDGKTRGNKNVHPIQQDRFQINKNVTDYSKSKLMTTKEISEISGISSRKVNSWFVDNHLMYKKGGDWYATKKGNEVGAVQKEGTYGKFIVWPEEITKNIK